MVNGVLLVVDDVVSCACASVARCMDTAKCIQFSLMNKVCALSLMIENGPVAFYLRLLDVFAAILSACLDNQTVDGGFST